MQSQAMAMNKISTLDKDAVPASRAKGSYYATRDVAKRAVELSLPMIEACRRDAGIVGSGFLYLVVMDPAMTPANASFDEAVLYEHACGDRAEWDADYAAFARAKAELSWTRGLDSRSLQDAAPHLLRAGDSLLWGSTCLDGIVVAASGAFPCFDEVFAGTVALWVRALAKQAREEEKGRLALDD